MKGVPVVSLAGGTFIVKHAGFNLMVRVRTFDQYTSTCSTEFYTVDKQMVRY